MKTARKHPATSAFLAAPLRLLLLAALLAGGCEDDDDGGGGGGGGGDFGDRDPTHCAVAGDSIAVGYGDAGAPWPARLAAMLGRPVANFSAGGARMTGQGPSQVGSAIGSKAGFIIIALGANDAINGADPEGVKAVLGALIERVRAVKAVPVVGNVIRMTGEHALFDGNVDAINAAIGDVCGREGVMLVNLHGAVSEGMLQPGGLHPNSDGQEAIARAFHGKLKGRVE
jgi:acyl-CoA thioesterase-1